MANQNSETPSIEGAPPVDDLAGTATTPPAAAAVTPPATDPTPPADAKPAETKPPEAALDWPARRAQIAGTDTKLLNRLSRYATEKDAIDALIHAQNKISSGNLKTAKPENATPEQLNQWRVDNGLPVKIEDYDLELGGGLVIGDDDKPAIDAFVKLAHEKGYTGEAVKDIVRFSMEQKQAELVAEREALQLADQESKIKTIATLRQEMGGNYQMNMNILSGFLNTLPATVKERFEQGRLGDGTPILCDPDMVRFLASTALEINPQATLPGGGANPMQTVTDELSKLRGMLGDTEGPYYKGPDAQKHQTRYRELLDIQNRLKTRG